MNKNSPIVAEPEDLAEIVRGKWLKPPTRPIHYVRSSVEFLEPGLEDFLFVPELFFGRNGPGRGQALLSCLDASELGASGFMVSERPRNLATDAPCLIVEDAPAALSLLAGHLQSRSNARRVAITGSAGKTTTKEMIMSALSAAGDVTGSIFNFNAGRSCIDLTLSNLAPIYDFCCAEISGVGNIKLQAAIFQPHVAVITNVLFEHVERFEKQGLAGDQVLEAIADRKVSLIRNLVHGGRAVLNRDDPGFEKQRRVLDERPDVQLVTFGSHEDSDIRLVQADLGPDSSDIRATAGGDEFCYHIAIPGEHMVSNSLATIAAATALGIDQKTACVGLEKFEPALRRGEIRTIPWGNGSITAINETVHSSVPGLRTLFRTLSKRDVAPDGRRIAVLGIIGELGNSMVEQMADLAAEAAATPIDYFYTNGEDPRFFNRQFPDRSRIAPHAGSLEQLLQMLEAELRPGDTVAFKGSRKPEAFSLRTVWQRLVETRVPAKADPVAEKIEDEIRILFAGDTYFGERFQAERSQKSQINYLDKFGYGYSTEKIRPLFDRAATAIVNLECALTARRPQQTAGDEPVRHFGSPDNSVKAFGQLGIAAVLLGNNHAMDYGEAGLHDTLAALSKAGVEGVGVGESRTAAQQPFTCEFSRCGSTFKLAVISGHEYSERHDREDNIYAGSAKWGVNNLNTTRLKAQIADLKADGYYVVVSPHWGERYRFRSGNQDRLARRIIDECHADLIVGHGSQVYGEITRIGSHWVLFSLGNLIFNSEGEYSQHGLMPYSFVAELCVRFYSAGYRLALNIYPIVSCNQISQFQPAFVDAGQFDQLTASLRHHYDPYFFDENIDVLQEDGRYFYQLKLV